MFDPDSPGLFTKNYQETHPKTTLGLNIALGAIAGYPFIVKQKPLKSDIPINATINTNDDTDTDSMGKIFKEAKDKAYNKVNEKYNIDKKLDAITEELDKLSKTYDVDGKIQAVKDFNVSDLKDRIERQLVVERKQKQSVIQMI